MSVRISRDVQLYDDLHVQLPLFVYRQNPTRSASTCQSVCHLEVGNGSMLVCHNSQVIDVGNRLVVFQLGTGSVDGF